VAVKVIVEDQMIDLKVNPKISLKDLLHNTARAVGRDLPGWWHACVVDGTGDNQTYQEGDTIKLYTATEESIRRVNEPRTPKGQAALIPKAIGGPPKFRRRTYRRRKEIGSGNYVRGEKSRFKTRSNSSTKSTLRR
jgi:hypothetical protein